MDPLKALGLCLGSSWFGQSGERRSQLFLAHALYQLSHTSGEGWDYLSECWACSSVRGRASFPKTSKACGTDSAWPLFPMAPCGNTGYGDQHRPQLQQGSGPRHGPWRQLGHRRHYGPGGNSGHPDRYGPGGSMALGH